MFLAETQSRKILAAIFLNELPRRKQRGIKYRNI